MTIAQLVNQNSYAIAVAVVLGWVGYEIVRRGPSLRAIALFALLAVGLAAPVVWLRTAQDDVRELEGALAGSGRPTLLEVYSDL